MIKRLIILTSDYIERLSLYVGKQWQNKRNKYNERKNFGAEKIKIKIKAKRNYNDQIHQHLFVVLISDHCEIFSE